MFFSVYIVPNHSLYKVTSKLSIHNKICFIKTVSNLTKYGTLSVSVSIYDVGKLSSQVNLEIPLSLMNN